MSKTSWDNCAMNSELRFPDVTGMSPEEGKQAFRAIVRERRNRDAARARELYENQWIETVLEFVHGRDIIACFVATEHEPPTARLLEALAEADKTLILPKLGPGLTRAWGFYRGADDLQQMAPGRPPEPSGPAFDNNYLDNADALIIPALAVSHSGERLGQGGGWYDRALKAVQPDARIGAMVFPWEFMSTPIPQDEMDVRVPYVLTPDEPVATFHNLA